MPNAHNNRHSVRYSVTFISLGIIIYRCVSIEESVNKPAKVCIKKYAQF